jgi:5-methylcytosine-specific restriction endonuclease McrBC regulatory subunit McrC
MLYQLAAYGLSTESSGKASIIYPTLSDDAREQRLALRDPVQSTAKGEIALRSINLSYIRCSSLREQAQPSRANKVKLAA